MTNNKLETKIYTCSVIDYLDFNQVRRSDLELIGIYLSKKISSNTNNTLGSSLYTDLAKLMAEENYEAVVNVQISQVYVHENGGDKIHGTIYGTALKRKVYKSK